MTLDRMRLSSRHCRLFFDGNLWQIVDLDSKNGVKVNGERIVDSKLFHGDRITLADDATLQLVWSRGPRKTRQWVKWGLIGLGVIVLAFAVIWAVNSR